MTASVSALRRLRQFPRVVLLVGLALSATALAAPAAEMRFPPISDPATGSLRPGKFVWIDLMTTDMTDARRFYGGLLGWSFAELGSGAQRYTVAYWGGAPVAGIVARPETPGQGPQARWIAYLSVPDVKVGVERVSAAGGQVLVPAQPVPGRGVMAIVADPDGVPFGLIRSDSGDPPDMLAPPGDWIWALYQSPAATGAAAFYQNIAGYEVLRDERFPQTSHYFLATGGFTRASLAEIPAERSGLRPDWVYFLRVTDMAASLKRAIELGGRVLVAARPDLYEGRIAVIADPQGAAVGLMTWESDDER